MADIHPQLLEDCLVIGHFPLCYLLLMRDANYPWFILVPDRDEMKEIYQLPKDDQSQLMIESTYLAEFLMKTFNGDKMNVAAIGNMVPQLHIHHVVRYHSDAAWPSPVWGKLPVKAYTEEALKDIIYKLNKLEFMDLDYETTYE
jgi:diadenosine tetraphosphate (Ap4A) HIT family hydrolase